MIARILLFVLALAAGAGAGAAAAEPFTDSARGPKPIMDTTEPPRLTNWVNDDQRRPRNYDMQPPTIPHRVDGYQVDRAFNKCLDCHARTRTEISQATPVSPTHYINRQGKVLPTISTRRYFCQQCHVAQEPVKPIVENTFQDVDTVVRNGRPSPTNAKK